MKILHINPLMCPLSFSRIIFSDTKYMVVKNKYQGIVVSSFNGTTEQSAPSLEYDYVVFTASADMTLSELKGVSAKVYLIDISNSKIKTARISALAKKKGMECRIFKTNTLEIGLPHDRDIEIAIIGQKATINRAKISGRPKIPISKIIQKVDSDKYKLSADMENYTIRDRANTLDREVLISISKHMHKMHLSTTDNYVTQDDGVRRLTPTEVIRANGMEPASDYKLPVSDTQGYILAAETTPLPILEDLIKSTELYLNAVSSDFFVLKGKEYYHDKILSVEPTFSDSRQVTFKIGGKTKKLPSIVFTKVSSNEKKKLFIITNKDNDEVKRYINENISLLATRDYIDGNKFDSLIEKV